MNEVAFQGGLGPHRKYMVVNARTVPLQHFRNLSIVACANDSIFA